MTAAIPEELLAPVGEFVAARLGLHFPPARWHDLARALAAAALESGFEDAATYAQWLVTADLTKDQLEALASQLTIGETYFFRDKASFAILEEQILPALIMARRAGERRLRLWSAGCASGEEPYSLAILLQRVLPDWRDWNITLLATDVNSHFLRKAAHGVYSDWSFRDSPAWLKERFFERKPRGRFELAPQIRKMVTFSYLNLAEDSYPALLSHTNAMDVILCRNVLMYFVPAQVEKVMQNLERSLVEGGWLIVSPTEASLVQLPQFKSVSFQGAVFYRKDSARLDTHGLGTTAAGVESGQPPRAAVAAPPPRDTAPLSAPAAFSEFSEQAQGDAQAFALLARAHANQGKLAEARAWCERAIAADRLDAGLYYLSAVIAEEQGALGEAAAALRRALYLDPNLVPAHFALGNLALRQGKRKTAGKHFENVLLLLGAYQSADILPESEGLTAGRLGDIVRAIYEVGA